VALLHDLPPVHPDIELAPNYIDVGSRVPLRPRVLAVRIAKGDMNAGEFLVLQNLADYVGQFNIGADGELAYAIAVFVSVGVRPEILFQCLVLAENFGDAIVAHRMVNGWCSRSPYLSQR
jgi:hypothetical protein